MLSVLYHFTGSDCANVTIPSKVDVRHIFAVTYANEQQILFSDWLRGTISVLDLGQCSDVIRLTVLAQHSCLAASLMLVVSNRALLTTFYMSQAPIGYLMLLAA